MQRVLNKIVVLGGGVISVLSLFLSCDNDISSPGPQVVKYAYFRDYEYAANRVFDLRPPIDTLMEADSIIEIRVFERSVNPGDSSFHANLYIDPRAPAADSEFRELGIPMVEAEPNRYWPVVSERASNRRYLIFKEEQNQWGIGVWMRVQGRREGRDTVFDIGTRSNTSANLFMLRPNGYFDPGHPTWSYMWRNCYSIPDDMDLGSLDFQIYLGAIGTESNPANVDIQFPGGFYLTLVGLDRTGPGGTGKPDGRLDLLPPTFREDLGLIIFPNRTPFNTDTTFVNSGNQTAPLQVKAPKIYDFRSLAELAGGSRYYFRYSTWQGHERHNHP